jgi:hypothetical protein
MAGKMSKTSRNAIVATLEGIRYVVVTVLAAGSICFLLVSLVDSSSSGSLRYVWFIRLMLNGAAGVIEQVASGLHAEWLLVLRRVAAPLVGFLLGGLSFFANAVLRALNSRITREVAD